MRRVREFDAFARERFVGGTDIIDFEINDGVVLRLAIPLAQEQAGAIAIKKRQIAEGIKMRQAERVAIPGRCRVDVRYVARDLADLSQSVVSAHNGLRMMKPAGVINAVPAFELPPGFKPELLQGIGDVIFNCVKADIMAFRDLPVGQAMAHRLDRSPLGRGQNIRMARPSALSLRAHGTLMT